MTAASERLLVSYEDVVKRTSDFAVEAADLVRGDPESVSDLLHRMAQVSAWVFQRWNLEILYLLSIAGPLRYGSIRDFTHGISGRSLSLKLDEMEHGGFVHRSVTDDKPPHVSYALTERGRTLARLSFPMVLHLSMDQGLRARLEAQPPGKTAPPRPNPLAESDAAPAKAKPPGGRQPLKSGPA